MAPLQDLAERSLAAMRSHGFEHAQVSASRTLQDELNLNLNEPTLLRSVESGRLALVGLLDGRRAATELTDLSGEAVDAGVDRLRADALLSPRDDAYAVSAGQRAGIVQGPQQAEPGVLAAKAAELLAFRARATPRMTIEEGAAAHTLRRSVTLTSGGSELQASVGWYDLSALGTAREGRRVSSFNHAGGSTDDLSARPADQHFGIGAMMRDLERQIDPQPLTARGVGEVVFAPTAVTDLLEWLQEQLGDTQLIAGSSLYAGSVGARIASPLLSLRSRFDAPGVAALSADAHVAPPVTVLRAGVLQCLTPTLYGSRKTGRAHVPVASAGWQIDAGDTELAAMIAGVQRGALVNRLSMGSPAPNGDFSGVVKNSFRIDGGELGAALAETMIAGNMARMLLEVSAVSRERLDTGALLLPWLRVGGLHFS